MQSLYNLTAGNYTLSFVYAARSKQKYADCVFNVKLNGTQAKSITPVDYLIHN